MDNSGSGDRKDRSLGALCCRFLAHFQEGDKDLICLDQAATDLGVERRRIYDVVNILEALEVVSRKEKNWYHWHGLECLPDTMQYLRNAAIYDNSVPMCDSVEELQGMGPLPDATQAAEATEAARSCRRSKGSYCRVPRAEDPTDKRERSMGALAQRFLQLFLVGRSAVTLEYAADCLMEGDGSAKMKTRVRRLYDIANVLCMLRVVAKDTIAGTRKPVFRWIGTEHVPDFRKIRPPTPPRRNNADSAEQRRASALTAAAAHGRDAASVRAQMAAGMGGMQLTQQQMLAAMAMQQQRHAMLAAMQQQQQQAAAAANGATTAGQQVSPPPGYTVMMVAGPNGPTPMLVSSAMIMQQMINMQAARGMLQQQQQQQQAQAQRAAAAASAAATAAASSGMAASATASAAPHGSSTFSNSSVGTGGSLPPRAPPVAAAVGPPESLLTDPGYGPGGVRNVILSAPHAGGWCILPGVVSQGVPTAEEHPFEPLQVATARTTGRGTGVDMGGRREPEVIATRQDLPPAQQVTVAHPTHGGSVRVGALRYNPAPAGRVATMVAMALTNLGPVPSPAGPSPYAALPAAGLSTVQLEQQQQQQGTIARTVEAAPMRPLDKDDEGHAGLPPREVGGATVTGNSSARAVPLVLVGQAAAQALEMHSGESSGQSLRDTTSRALVQDDDLMDDAGTDAGSFAGGVQGGWMAPDAMADGDAASTSGGGGTAIYGWSVPVAGTPVPPGRSASSVTGGGSVVGMSPAVASDPELVYRAGAPPTACASTVKKTAGALADAASTSASVSAFLSPARGRSAVNSAAEASPYVGGVEGMPLSSSNGLAEFLANRREAMAASMNTARNTSGRMATVAGAGGAVASADAALGGAAGSGIAAGFTPLKGGGAEYDAGDGVAEFMETARQIRQNIDTARAAAESNGTALGGRATGGASARRRGRKRKSILMGGGAPPRAAGGSSVLNFSMFSPAAAQSTSRQGGIATSASTRRVAARTTFSAASPGDAGRLNCTPQRFFAAGGAAPAAAATPGLTALFSSPETSRQGGAMQLDVFESCGIASPPRSAGILRSTAALSERRGPATMMLMSPFASTVAFRVDAEEGRAEHGTLMSPSPVHSSFQGGKARSAEVAPNTAPRVLRCAEADTTAASLTLSASTGTSASSGSLAASEPGGSLPPASACSLHSGAGDISHIPPSTGSSRAAPGGRGGALLSPIPSMNLSARLEQAASTAQRRPLDANRCLNTPGQRGSARKSGSVSARRRVLSSDADCLDTSLVSLNLQAETS